MRKGEEENERGEGEVEGGEIVCCELTRGYYVLALCCRVPLSYVLGCIVLLSPRRPLSAWQHNATD